MSSNWPISLAGIVIGLVAFMLALGNLWVPAILMFILALTIVLLPYRRRANFLRRREIMRLCPRNIALGVAALGLLCSLIGMPLLGLPLVVAGVAFYYFWPRRGPGRRPRR